MLITPTVAPHLLHFRSKSAPRVSATMQRRNRLHDSLPSKPIAEGDAKSAGCRGGVAARSCGYQRQRNAPRGAAQEQPRRRLSGLQKVVARSGHKSGERRAESGEQTQEKKEAVDVSL